MNEPIAQLALKAFPVDGEACAVAVSLGAPRLQTSEAGFPPVWACELSLSPLLPRPVMIFGADSLQALVLAGRLALQTLLNFLAQGGRLAHPEGGAMDATSLSEAYPFAITHRHGATPPLWLRPATPQDAEAVASLLILSRLIDMPHAPSAHPDEALRRWVRDQLLPGGGVTLAVQLPDSARHDAPDTVLGVMATQREGDTAWINQMHVAPGHTGQGIGTRLLQQALRTLPRPIRLYTFQASTRARRFYERQGFVAIELGDGSGNEEGCPDVLYELTTAP